jgi:exopolysaccharide biosynthesis WecB/TagA/CpsF family protein
VSNYNVCDSQILLYASRLLGTPLREKISGSDLLPAFYTHHRHNESIKIFLLGAREGVATQAQQNINRKIGRNIVIASYSPSFGFENNLLECQQIIEMINNSGATVLVVGVGAPKQEKWICKYKEELKNIKIFMALGATIDFEAGNMKRAPKWISQTGFEWLFRLLCEPKRLWKRYLIEDIPFLLLILKQKFSFYLQKDYLKKSPKNSRNPWHTVSKY